MVGRAACTSGGSRHAYRRHAALPAVAVLLADAVAARDAPSGSASRVTQVLNDGTSMPVVGLGTWKSKPNEVENAVCHAICHAGYRHIDAAQIYMNQEEVGRGLARAAAECGVPRKDVWITSKVWMIDYEPSDVLPAVDRILRELGVDYVDQLLLHWPIPYARPPAGCPPSCPQRWAGTDDPLRPRNAAGHIVTGDTPLVDTWCALEAAKRVGKVRSIGVSNFNIEDIKSLTAGRRDAILPAVNQVEAHVFWNQAALREAMEAMGIAVIAYTPLSNAAVYGDRSGIDTDLVRDIAAQTGLTPAQVMLNYLIAKGWVVLPKSVTPSRIDENFKFELRLSAEHLARLEREAPQRRLSNPTNRPNGQHVFDDAPVERGEL